MLEKLLTIAIEFGIVPKVYECIEDAQKEFNTTEWSFVPFRRASSIYWVDKYTREVVDSNYKPEVRSRNYSQYYTLFTRVFLAFSTVALIISIFTNGIFSETTFQFILLNGLLYIGFMNVTVMMIILFMIGLVGVFFLCVIPFNFELLKEFFSAKRFFGVGVLLELICLFFSIKIFKNRFDVGQVLISKNMILVKYDIGKEQPISKSDLY